MLTDRSCGDIGLKEGLITALRELIFKVGHQDGTDERGFQTFKPGTTYTENIHQAMNFVFNYEYILYTMVRIRTKNYAISNMTTAPLTPVICGKYMYYVNI